MESLKQVYLILTAVCALSFTLHRQHFSFNVIPLIILLTVALLTELITNLGLMFQTYVYQVLELLMLGLVYKSAVRYKKNKTYISWLIYVSVPSLILLTFIDGVSESPFFTSILSPFVIIIMSLLYLSESYRPPFEQLKIYKIPFFWINTANLIFYTVTFFFYAMFRLIESAELLEVLNIIPQVGNFILLTLYLIGSTCQKIFK